MSLTLTLMDDKFPKRGNPALSSIEYQGTAQLAQGPTASDELQPSNMDTHSSLHE